MRASALACQASILSATSWGGSVGPPSSGPVPSASCADTSISIYDWGPSAVLPLREDLDRSLPNVVPHPPETAVGSGSLLLSFCPSCECRPSQCRCRSCSRWAPSCPVAANGWPTTSTNSTLKETSDVARLNTLVVGRDFRRGRQSPMRSGRWCLGELRTNHWGASSWGNRVALTPNAANNLAEGKSPVLRPEWLWIQTSVQTEIPDRHIHTCVLVCMRVSARM